MAIQSLTNTNISDFHFFLALKSAVEGQTGSSHPKDAERLHYVEIYKCLEKMLPWIAAEVSYMSIQMDEAGVFRSQGLPDGSQMIITYLCYSLAKSLCLLRELHNDHEHRKNWTQTTVMNTIAVVPSQIGTTDMEHFSSIASFMLMDDELYD